MKKVHEVVAALNIEPHHNDGRLYCLRRSKEMKIEFRAWQGRRLVVAYT
jgi:hypothetical protein